MPHKNRNIVYYAFFISIAVHGVFLCVSFGGRTTDIQKHTLNVTMHTYTILPHVEHAADTTRLKNNPAKPVKEGGVMASQYMVSNEDSQTVTMQYTDMIRQRIQESLVYPATARKDGIEGKTYIKFTIDKNGNLLSAIMVRSSGSALLDDAALKAIHSASPFPAIPDTIGRERMTFVQGLTFTLK
ncbi:MAG TPA: energy transducer TonB [Spirochaetota bacterium]|nr:energy transducer TonB [Spirochaetota bacterium]HOM08607.1 energy transducer TonB [Spirochaetota bacterium]HPP48426.1 energy transducer TonB [Spirochaetota bacterium]HXK66107.1 energy transducer TonB [Spirochaetota bacterium]